MKQGKTGWQPTPTRFVRSMPHKALEAVHEALLRAADRVQVAQ